MTDRFDFSGADVAVGDWTCPCGILRVSNVTGNEVASMLFQCPSCGESAEILAEEKTQP